MSANSQWCYTPATDESMARLRAQRYYVPPGVSPELLRLVLCAMLLLLVASCAGMVWQARVIHAQKALIHDLYDDAWTGGNAPAHRIHARKS